MEGCVNQKPAGSEDGCGKELAEWYKMLRKAELWRSAPPAPTPAPETKTKPAPKKPPMGLSDLPAECTAVLKSGGGAPVVAADGTVPAALKAQGGKDAGPPIPRLDPAAYAALKAEIANPKAKAKSATKEAPATATLLEVDRMGWDPLVLVFGSRSRDRAPADGGGEPAEQGPGDEAEPVARQG